MAQGLPNGDYFFDAGCIGATKTSPTKTWEIESAPDADVLYILQSGLATRSESILTYRAFRMPSLLGATP